MTRAPFAVIGRVATVPRDAPANSNEPDAANDNWSPDDAA